MKRVLISLILFLACGTGMISDHIENHQFIHDQLQMDRQRFRVLRTPESLQRQWSAGAENQAFLDAQALQLRQSIQSGEHSVDVILTFVSLSMPPNEPKQCVEGMAELNIPVTIRGIVSGDVRATANAAAGLVKESDTGGVQIDPTTLRKYNITAVPTLIVAYGNQGDTADRLQGDLTLHQALKRVAEVGDCAGTARNLLRGEV